MHPEVDKNKIKNGLYIVSTPIGNLGDITYRATKILNNSDFILCEDTRVSKKLLSKYKISKNLISNHKFNEKKNIGKIINILKSNKTVSLISDAGTPTISDPGRIIIEECIKNLKLRNFNINFNFCVNLENSSNRKKNRIFLNSFIIIYFLQSLCN